MAPATSNVDPNDGGGNVLVVLLNALNLHLYFELLKAPSICGWAVEFVIVVKSATNFPIQGSTTSTVTSIGRLRIAVSSFQ